MNMNEKLRNVIEEIKMENIPQTKLSNGDVNKPCTLWNIKLKDESGDLNVGQLLHERFVGMEEYIDSRILLNCDKHDEIILIFEESCKFSVVEQYRIIIKSIRGAIRVMESKSIDHHVEKLEKIEDLNSTSMKFQYKDDKEEYEISGRLFADMINSDFSNMEFCLQDLQSLIQEESKHDKMHIFSKVAIIDRFVVKPECRNKGIGSEELNNFIARHNDFIIVVCSGALKSEYKEEPTNEMYEEINGRLRDFYTKKGFVNVNNEIGHYEFKETFIYNNDAAKLILDAIYKERKDV